MSVLVDNPAASRVPSERDAELAARSSQEIADFVNGSEEALHVQLTRENGEQTDIAVPGTALQVLAQVLSSMAKGDPVTVIPLHAELTTHQAAALMHVSRPYLIKLLDSGQITCRKVGAHRRIRYDDLRAYMDRQKQEREAVLRDLVAENQRLGLYDE